MELSFQKLTCHYSRTVLHTKNAYILLNF